MSVCYVDVGGHVILWLKSHHIMRLQGYFRAFPMILKVMLVIHIGWTDVFCEVHQVTLSNAFKEYIENFSLWKCLKLREV